MARSLFGGAITSVIPQRFMDVSEFRIISDNQEVLHDITTDQSIIVELLSLVEDVSHENAAEFHFMELARENEALCDSSIATNRCLANEELPNFDGSKVHRYYVLGTQRISKFKEDAKNVVEIYMALIRIPHITTDILITMNVPVSFDPRSSSSANIVVANQASSEPSKVFQEVLRSLKILDWGLFL